MPNFGKQNAGKAGARVDLAGGREATNQIQQSESNTNSALLNNKLSSVPTMTSREIAELVESRHDTVKLCIERLADRGTITLPPMVEVSNSGAGPKVIAEYHVGKRDSYVIVAQLSPEFTARLVDRWQELEAAASLAGLPDFTNPAASARAWADQVEAREALRLELAATAPAVEFVQGYVDCTGLKGFREVCKLLGANETLFRKFLTDKDVMYLLGREWMPYAVHLDAGRFKVKAGKSDFNGHAFNSARFTPKGVNWAAGEFAKYLLEQRQ